MQNSFTKPTDHKLKPFRTNKISKRKKSRKTKYIPDRVNKVKD